MTTSPASERGSARCCRPPPRSSRPARGPGAGCSTSYALRARSGARRRARCRRWPILRPGPRAGRRAALRRGGDAAQGPRRAARGAGHARGPAVALRLRRFAGPRPGLRRRPRTPGRDERDRRPGSLRRPADRRDLDAAYAAADAAGAGVARRDLRHGRRPRRWPAGSRSSRRSSAGCRRPSAWPPTAAGRACWCRPATRRRSPRRCAAGSATRSCGERLRRAARAAPRRPLSGLAGRRRTRIARVLAEVAAMTVSPPTRTWWTWARAAGRCRHPRRAGLAARHRPVPRRRPHGRRVVAGGGGRHRGADHGLLRLAVEPGRRRPRRRRPAARGGRRVLPLAVPQHDAARRRARRRAPGVRHGRDVGDVGREPAGRRLGTRRRARSCRSCWPSPCCCCCRRRCGRSCPSPSACSLAGSLAAVLAQSGRCRAAGRRCRPGRVRTLAAADVRDGLLARRGWPGIVLASSRGRGRARR